MNKSDFKIVEENGLFHLLRKKAVKRWPWSKPMDEFYIVNRDGHFTSYDWEFGWSRGKPFNSKNINDIRERVDELTKDPVYHNV